VPWTRSGESFGTRRTGISYAFNVNGDLVRESTPWERAGPDVVPGHAGKGARLAGAPGLLRSHHGLGRAHAFGKKPLFEPLNYNYGAAWPFLNQLGGRSPVQTRFPRPRLQFTDELGRSHFRQRSGLRHRGLLRARNIWPQEAVPHQGFCSAGVVLPFVRGLLGLEGDAPEKRIAFEPHFPADWSEVSIENFEWGQRSFRSL